jgi:hypothetical protein
VLVLDWNIKRDHVYKDVFEIDAPTTVGQKGLSASDAHEHPPELLERAERRHVVPGVR